VPERRWIVPGWVPLGTTTLLYGDGGLGKSLLAMQLATACATGGKWLDMEVMSVKALMVSCEDEGDELHRRQLAINSLYDIDFEDLDKLSFIPRIDDENSLMTFHRFDDEPPEVTPLYQQIHDFASDMGCQLVIFDSLHDVFDGRENERKHARRFIKALTQLARDIDGAVVVCAHPSLDGLKTGAGTSGSTAWSNACRSRLFLSRPKDRDADTDAEDVRVLKRMKSNYARSGDEIMVRWRDGAFVREHEPTGTLKAMDDRRVEKIFLECLDATTVQGRALSDSNRAGNYGPKIMATMPEAVGVKKRAFEGVMTRLFNDGTIIVGTPFRKANRHPARGIMRAPTKVNDDGKL
jgi:RecA-family ATPase